MQVIAMKDFEMLSKSVDGQCVCVILFADEMDSTPELLVNVIATLYYYLDYKQRAKRCAFDGCRKPLVNNFNILPSPRMCTRDACVLVYTCLLIIKSLKVK